MLSFSTVTMLIPKFRTRFNLKLLAQTSKLTLNIKSEAILQRLLLDQRHQTVSSKMFYKTQTLFPKQIYCLPVLCHRNFAD